MPEDFTISTDKSRLEIETIHRYLSERSYWAKGRSLETVQKAIENSLCFGIYDSKNRFAGFARVATDFAVFAFMMDVFVLEEYRGKGLGKKLMAHIVHFPVLRGLKRWQLVTSDAHGLYEKYGFAKLAEPQKHMERVDPNRC